MVVERTEKRGGAELAARRKAPEKEELEPRKKKSNNMGGEQDTWGHAEVFGISQQRQERLHFKSHAVRQKGKLREAAEKDIEEGLKIAVRRSLKSGERSAAVEDIRGGHEQLFGKSLNWLDLRADPNGKEAHRQLPKSDL